MSAIELCLAHNRYYKCDAIWPKETKCLKGRDATVSFYKWQVSDEQVEKA